MNLRALRAATIALVATAAGAVTPRVVGGQDISCEPGDLEVRDLDFRGNRSFDDDDLKLRVTTTASSWARRKLRLPLGTKRCLEPSRQTLGRDIEYLEIYYRRQRGFHAAQIDTVVEPLGRNAVRVIFNIVEGDPTRLTSYTITGLEGIPDSADIVRRLQLRVGDPFDLIRYGADMDTIVRRLRESGYYRASTIPGYEWDTAGVAHAEASITVVPGKLARFEQPDPQITDVDGDTTHIQIPKRVVQRVMGIAPGQLYSDRAILEAQRSLFQLGTYQHIEIAALPDSAQPPGDTLVRLGVQLREDFMRQLDSEFGWATLDCGRVRLQYTDRNLLHSARRLEVTGQVSKLGYGNPVASKETQRVCTLGGQSPLGADSIFSRQIHYFTGIAVRQPRLLGTRWVPTLSVYSERRGEYKAYLRSTQVGADISATRDIGLRMPLRVGYTYEFGRTVADPPALCVLFNRCDQLSQDQIQELEPLGVASVALARIRTDNPISPTRGLMMRGEMRTSASELLLTSKSLFFNKGTGDIAWYAPVGNGNVVMARLRGGLVLGRRQELGDPTAFVPPQERLYAGGPNSVRGFQQNELGSKVYIASRDEVAVDTVVTGPETLYRFRLLTDAEAAARNVGVDSTPERAVPLGGNSLFVANLEYRIRDPFFFPDHLQYTLFVDGGDVWSRGAGQLPAKIKWTPGLGFRALTPVGPMQLNIGINGYKPDEGPLYYNPDVTLLACLSPDGGVPFDYRRDAVSGQYRQVTTGTCGNFNPPRRERWFQKLTFTFSIGPDF
jgi:outer membrane protein assembly factor BamA